MLQNLRRISHHFLIKILFFILVLSFGLWGVGDIVRNYLSNRPVVTVNQDHMGIEPFLRNYHFVSQDLKSSKSQAHLSSAEIAELVVSSYVDETLFKQLIENEHLIVSDLAIRNTVHGLQIFQEKGFDRKQFELFLRHSGISEPEFLNKIRSYLLRKQYFESLQIGLRLPTFYQSHLFQASTQKRRFSSIKIPLSHAVIKEVPTDQLLTEFYQANQELFTVPETRSISMVSINPEVLKSQLHLSDTDLKKIYELRKMNFKVPEKRDVVETILESKSQAEFIVAALRSGKPLEALVSPNQIKKHVNALQESFYTPHGKAIFELPEGGISDPLDSAFGYAVFIVKKVIPSTQQSFETVKGVLKQQFIQEQITGKMESLKAKLEDAILEEESLEFVAKRVNLPVENHVLSKRSSEESSVLLKEAFQLPEKGMNRSLLEEKNGVFFVMQLDHMTPKHLPEFSKIRDQVQIRWKENAQRIEAMKLANKIATSVHSIADLKRMAKANLLSVTDLPLLSPQDVQTSQIPRSVLEKGFLSPPGKAVSQQAQDGVYVLFLQEVLENKDEQARIQFNTTLKSMLGEDLEKNLLAHLKSKSKLHINQEMISKFIEEKSAS